MQLKISVAPSLADLTPQLACSESQSGEHRLKVEKVLPGCPPAKQPTTKDLAMEILTQFLTEPRCPHRPSKCAKYMPNRVSMTCVSISNRCQPFSSSWMVGLFAAKQDLRGSECSEKAIFQKRRGSFFSQMAGERPMYFLVCASREESFPCSIAGCSAAKQRPRARRWIAPLPWPGRQRTRFAGRRGHDGGSRILHSPYQTRQPVDSSSTLLV